MDWGTVLIIAGLVLILARDRIGIAYGKQYENLRGRLRSLPREPAYLRPMAPVVGAAGWAEDYCYWVFSSGSDHRAARRHAQAERGNVRTVGDSGRVTLAIGEALDLIFNDLAAGGVPLPRVERTAWQPWQPSESVTLFAADRGGVGVWLDLSLSDEDALAHLADQVQEWIVGELWRLGRPTNWPICAAHPATHPRQAVVEHGRAVWACPVGAPDSSPIGELPSD